MDEKQFKKHLADLAHGHHHPEERDWEDACRRLTRDDEKIHGSASKHHTGDPSFYVFSLCLLW